MLCTLRMNASETGRVLGLSGKTQTDADYVHVKESVKDVVGPILRIWYNNLSPGLQWDDLD